MRFEFFRDRSLDFCENVVHEIRSDLSYVYKYIVCKVVESARVCYENNLRCVDVPVLSTYLLKRELGLDYRSVRKIWRLLSKTLRGNSKLRVFETDSFYLDLVFSFRKGPVYVDKELNVLIGEADAENMSECILIPKSLLLYIDVEAQTLDNIYVKANLVYLFKKLYELGLSDLAVDLAKLSLTLLECIVFKRDLIRSVLAQTVRVASELATLSGLLRDFTQLDQFTPLNIIVHVPYLRRVASKVLSSIASWFSR